MEKLLKFIIGFQSWESAFQGSSKGIILIIDKIYKNKINTVKNHKRSPIQWPNCSRASLRLTQAIGGLFYPHLFFNLPYYGHISYGLLKILPFIIDNFSKLVKLLNVSIFSVISQYLYKIVMEMKKTADGLSGSAL